MDGSGYNKYVFQINHPKTLGEKFLQFCQVGQVIFIENSSPNIVFDGNPCKSVKRGLPAVRVERILQINLNKIWSIFSLFQ